MKASKGFRLLAKSWSKEQYKQCMEAYLSLGYELQVFRTITGRFYIFGRGR